MRRHDLAYLRPGCNLAFQCGALDPALEGRITAWIAAGYPMVLARQIRDSTQILLGLTLPAKEGKRRIGCLVSPSDILRVTTALSIEFVLEAIPSSLNVPLGELARTLKECEIELGLFGSLAWEIITGEEYRNENSDVDVVCDVCSQEQLIKALAALQKASEVLPCGLDGEIRFPDGNAVSWKELANAWPNSDMKVLVKGPHDVFLETISTLVSAFNEVKAYA